MAANHKCTVPLGGGDSSSSLGLLSHQKRGDNLLFTRIRSRTFLPLPDLPRGPIKPVRSVSNCGEDVYYVSGRKRALVHLLLELSSLWRV